MKINWISYYHTWDGYGRFSSRLVQALQMLGMDAKPATMDHVTMPYWLQKQEGIDWSGLTISFLPPDKLQQVPGRQWLFSMTEGSRIPEEWVQRINRCDVERVIVPCQHNAKAFKESGVIAPVFVVPGGTDPNEFPWYKRNRDIDEPYTFLTIADRGSRKGWEEVWDAFYMAFGGKTTGLQDVRLIIKGRNHKTVALLDMMSKAEGADKRIVYIKNDVEDMIDIYRQADCLVLPSRSEGWGMPHREAACMGIPVITQKYSGLDDGFTEQWSLVVEQGQMVPTPKSSDSLGEWRVVDKFWLSEMMRFVFNQKWYTEGRANQAAQWIRDNQTWIHSAQKLKQMIEGKDAAISVGRTTVPVLNRT